MPAIDDDRVMLGRIVVLTEYRHQGLGTLVVREAEKWAKTCRGAMTRFIIENRIDKPEDICAFSYEGFVYDPTLGEPDFPHFIKDSFDRE